MDQPRSAAPSTRRPLRAESRAQSNLLLAALPASERRRLLRLFKPVELAFGELLDEPDRMMRYVYFPTSAIISLISSLGGRTLLEVGLVGFEGMAGVSLVTGVKLAPLRALVQGEGSALRMDARRFSMALGRSRVLQQVMTRYMYILMSQLAQMAACTRFHLVEARLARWLLMTRDRARSDQFPITQEFLGYMLGVRRVGITQAARSLQRRKLIRYSRGNMTILNGRGLEGAACECYAAERHIYARHMLGRSGRLT